MRGGKRKGRRDHPGREGKAGPRKSRESGKWATRGEAGKTGRKQKGGKNGRRGGKGKREHGKGS